MGESFISKSFLFEVVDTETQRIETSFTLVLPPTAYTIREKQRVNITKTFGNAFIDDYGPDNLELTIKGISGTAHVYPTFRTTGHRTASANSAFLQSQMGGIPATEGYRHKEAFYTFRDDIMRYKDTFPDSFNRKELRVYDLGDEQAYRCVLLEFAVDRTAEKPFYYPFTISLFVYQKMGTKDIANPKKIDVAKNPLQSLSALTTSITSINTQFQVFNNIRTLRNQISLVSYQTSLLRAKFNTWLTQTRAVVESPLLLTKQLISTIADLGGMIYDAYTQGKITVDTWINAQETITDQMREVLGVYGFSIQEGAQQPAEKLVAYKTGMDYSSPSSPIPTSSLESYLFNGVNLYSVRMGDTLQSIAKTQLGDATLWPYIAAVNRTIYSNEDLVVGDNIYVPVGVEIGSTNKDNFILTEDAARDPYGTDIRVDSDGNIVLNESNDASLIGGVPNVFQAIDLHMKTEAGSVITQTAYGLVAQPGLAGTAHALSYVKMNFTDALMKDPRIAQVKNVQITIDRDAIHCGADIYLVGREGSLPLDVVLE